MQVETRKAESDSHTEDSIVKEEVKCYDLTFVNEPHILYCLSSFIVNIKEIKN